MGCSGGLWGMVAEVERRGGGQMFLGTYTPKLDDKGRLTLPAKFRDALAGGLMVTKSQDHSLAVYPRTEFEQLGRRHRRTASRRPGPDHLVGRPPPLREPLQGVCGDRIG